MKHTYILIIGMFCLFNINAQDRYLPGYLIDTTGQTIECEIYYRAWLANPERIRIRKDDFVQRYDKHQIVEFGLTTEKRERVRYLGRTLQLNVSPNDMNNLPLKPEPVFRTERILMEEVISGDMSMYRYIGQLNKWHYFLEKEDHMSELIHNLYQMQVNDRTQLMHNYQYRTQLQDLMSDCASITFTDIKDLEYQEGPIRKLVNKYNACKSGEEIVQKERTPLKVNFEFFGGVSNIAVDFNGEARSHIEQGDIDNYMSPHLGLDAFFYFPSGNLRIGLGASLNYTAHEYEEFLELPTTSPAITTENTYNFKANYIKFNPFLRLAILRRAPFSIEMDLGGNLQFITGVKNDWTEDKFISGVYSSTRNEPIYTSAKSVDFGFSGALNFTFSRINVKLKYETSEGVADESNFGTPTTFMSATVGYRLYTDERLP